MAFAVATGVEKIEPSGGGLNDQRCWALLELSFFDGGVEKSIKASSLQDFKGVVCGMFLEDFFRQLVSFQSFFDMYV